MQQGAATAAAAYQAGASVAGSKTKKGERQVHEERWKVAAQSAANYSQSGSAGSRILTELTLEAPIRYNSNDPVEKWLNNLLCMDITANSTRMVNVMPAPKDCDLYLVNRDALFSSHGLSEALLQRIWALYTAAHYKNSPNDLQMLSDAPAHRFIPCTGLKRTILTCSEINEISAFLHLTTSVSSVSVPPTTLFYYFLGYSCCWVLRTPHPQVEQLLYRMCCVCCKWPSKDSSRRKVYRARCPDPVRHPVSHPFIFFCNRSYSSLKAPISLISPSSPPSLLQQLTC